MWGEGNPTALLIGMQTDEATAETVWDIFIKLKLELSFDTAIPLLGIYPKNPVIPIQRNLCTPMFTAALLYYINIIRKINFIINYT